jgi:hypothetical protein
MALDAFSQPVSSKGQFILNHVSCSQYDDNEAAPTLPVMQCEFPPQISGATLSALMCGDLANPFDDIILVDCRYSYEFAAGHIAGAVNLTIFKQMETLFFTKLGKRICFIFYCELSVNRSRKWTELFRSFDRSMPGTIWPDLHFPEIYLLEGGYRKFYEAYSETELIVGGYCPMTDDASPGKHLLKSCSRLFTKETSPGRTPRKRIVRPIEPIEFSSPELDGDLTTSGFFGFLSQRYA